MGRFRLRLLSVFLTAAVLGVAPAGASDRDVTVDDVIRLAQSGISDATMIAFLDTQQIGFTIDADILLQLRSAGVSEGVIQFLLERARPTPAPPLTYADPVAPPDRYPVPYPRAYYAAPVGVFFSVGLPHRRHHRAFVHRRHHHGVRVRRLPVAAGHFPVAAGHFPVAAGHFPVAAGHFPSVAGHRTRTVGHVRHAGRHVHHRHGGHGGPRGRH